MTTPRGTRPTGPKRWPLTQERRRVKAIDLSKATLKLLDDARDKLDKRDHPALIALDIADAARYAELRAAGRLLEARVLKYQAIVIRAANRI